MKSNHLAPLPLLLWVTLANYAAQVPYYLHNYYLPYHSPPSLLGIILLGTTLMWFLGGYIGARKGWRLGNPLLLSFLVVETLFYAHAILFGAFMFQLQNPSALIRGVFIFGYVSGTIAGYYAYRLFFGRRTN